MKKILLTTTACLFLMLLNAPMAQASVLGVITHDYGSAYSPTSIDAADVHNDYVYVGYNSDPRFGDNFNLSNITTDYSSLSNITLTLSYSGASDQSFLFGSEKWYVREANDYANYENSNFDLDGSTEFIFSSETLGEAGWNALVKTLTMNRGIFSLVFSEEGWFAGLGDYGFDLDSVTLTANGTAATPIPGAIWLLGSGLVGLVGIRRKMKA